MSKILHLSVEYDNVHDLAEAEWQATPSESTWDLLARLLTAWASEYSPIGLAPGRLSVHLADGAGHPALWAFAPDAAGLANLLARLATERTAGRAWLPTEAVLRTDTELLLPPDVSGIDLAHPDDYDRERAEPLPLLPTTAIAAGTFRVWRLPAALSASEELSPVWIELLASGSREAPGWSLRVRSRLDLWCEDRDGAPCDDPVGLANQHHLRTAIRELAKRTGGVSP